MKVLEVELAVTHFLSKTHLLGWLKKHAGGLK